MSKSTNAEINEKADKIIELLEGAMPGTGPTPQRAANRAKANEIAKTMPSGWLRRINAAKRCRIMTMA